MSLTTLFAATAASLFHVVEPIAVGADLRDRHARAGALARMALRAVGVEHGFAGCGFLRVDRERDI